MISAPKTLVIHHSAIEDAVQLPLIEKGHAAEGYPASHLDEDSHVCYHYLVGLDSTVKQLRSLSERAGCTRNQQVNLEAIHIVVAGNFEKNPPNSVQLVAVRNLITRLDAVFKFERIEGHRHASPTACPGKLLIEALADVWRNVDTSTKFQVSRYYTPVRHQKRYYRSVTSTAQMLDKALEFGVVKLENGNYVHYEETPAMTFTAQLGKTKDEAIAYIDSHEQTHFLMKREVEYQMDFKVNCQGDCFVPADGSDLRKVAPMTVVACPGDNPKTPEKEGYPLGTKFDIEGLGIVTCVDRGGAIKGNRIDLYTGSGDEGLQRILTTDTGGLRSGKVLE